MNQVTLNVLLIEDNPADVRLIETLLQRTQGCHYQIDRVETLAQAIESAIKNSYAVILLDLSLPDAKGVETCQTMYAQAPHIPMIVLTGLDDEVTAISALKAGAQDYIFKNELRPNMLTRAIHYAIRRKETLEKLRQSEARYRGIIEDQTEFICRFLADGTITFINRAFSLFCHQEPEALVGQRISYGLFDRDWSQLQKKLEQITLNSPTVTLELPISSQNVPAIWQSWTIRGIFTSQKTLAEYQAVGRDITDTKQVELILRKQAQQEKIFSIITQKIRQSLNLEEILKTTVREVRKLLQVDRVLIYSVQSEASLNVLVESVAAGCGSVVGETIENVNLEEVLDYGKTSDLKLGVIEQISPQARSAFEEKLHQWQVKSQLVIQIKCFELPLPDRDMGMESPQELLQKTPESLWGLLALQDCRSPRSWPEEQLELLQKITHQVAIAIRQGQLYQQLAQTNQMLHQMATLDGLTGIANRRRFDQYLAVEWRRLAREGAPLSIILCDIDHFKLYNDTYGHQAGDDCLRNVAQAIASSAQRPADLVARYGGEEFVVVLPYTPLQGALQVANKIQQQINSMHMEHLASPICSHLTLSLGVACKIPQVEIEPYQLLINADEALYQSKAQGRNTIQTHGLSLEGQSSFV
ncbi:diguanylate cyclase [Roseofilum sp. BLCC_M91]|uniref:Diguanylate cyclase n=1 Tax=Roseofilum halophilum BLCC-M91 TaxID=3022259 RepID=A0ABT7BMU6_9CYAN|nr:diguanylate cyclase [Roseofilum halophilum]MDJ1179796.1 diguanylate cyclase [Roseofilum halophilum BLCC-M91]